MQTDPVNHVSLRPIIMAVSPLPSRNCCQITNPIDVCETSPTREKPSLTECCNMTDVVDLCLSGDEDDVRVSGSKAPGVIDLVEVPASAPLAPTRLRVPNQQPTQAVIDLVDRKPAARRRFPSATLDLTEAESEPENIPVAASFPHPPRVPAATVQSPINPPETTAVATPKANPKPSPILRIFEVFPDVDSEHAQKVLRDCNNNVDMVLGILAERSDYPKSKRPATEQETPSGYLVKRPKVQPKYDYHSTTSFQPSPLYINEARSQLLHEFYFLSVAGARSLLVTHKFHFSIVHKFLLDALKQGSDPSAGKATPSDDYVLASYEIFKKTWASKRLTSMQRVAVGESKCLKTPRRHPVPTITDEILLEEVLYCRKKLEEWMDSMEEKKRRQFARKRVEQTGTGVECSCCFDRVPFDEMVACRNEGHLFCMECIENYANTAVFSNGSLGVVKETGRPSCELLCCDSSGCQSGFQEAHLEKALSLKVLEKYNELQFRANLEAAGIQDEICTCPKCGFQADLPENLVVFQCPMDDCRYESCRKCGKAAHVPLRCEEVAKQKREDDGRLKVEEAISEAKIRRCPQCKASFVKSDGCNKMTCRCGTKICYICRARLSAQNPYSHFCQRPHCDHQNCGNCKLYSNAEEDDERAMREAGVSAAENYRQEIKEQGGETDINIDVDSILTKGAPAGQRHPLHRRR
eukprot:Nitzschia sp. Nitz4//scaffold22_size323478//199860//202015//NITZ4_000555-RA/size323478-snap-gene-0.516-mRNA-1//1//CDS//3329543079//596//frame0